jgi:hypothetical protein
MILNNFPIPQDAQVVIGILGHGTLALSTYRELQRIAEYSIGIRYRDSHAIDRSQ